jgi:hypothetical protein
MNLFAFSSEIAIIFALVFTVLWAVLTLAMSFFAFALSTVGAVLVQALIIFISTISTVIAWTVTVHWWTLWALSSISGFVHGTSSSVFGSTSGIVDIVHHVVEHTSVFVFISVAFSTAGST